MTGFKSYGLGYDPRDTELFLRDYAPGFSRMGKPRYVEDTTSNEHFKKHGPNAYEISKNKSEIIHEYGLIMKLVYWRVFKALIGSIIALYCIMGVLSGAGALYVAGGMLAVAYSMYWWWHSGAAYSNWQEFEMRPILLPIEDVSKMQG